MTNDKKDRHCFCYIVDFDECNLNEDAFSTAKFNALETTAKKLYSTEDYQWIFIPAEIKKGGEIPNKPEKQAMQANGTLNFLTQKILPKIQSYNKKFFGIHGKDLGIPSTIYDEKDTKIEDISGINSGIITKIQNFTNGLNPEDSPSSNCVIKVFSHTHTSTIYTEIRKGLNSFCTFDVQDKIFDITAPGPDTRANKMDQLEVLFFEFRLCLAALNAYCTKSSEDKSDQDKKKIVKRLLFLLCGGALKKNWTEELFLSQNKDPDNRESIERNYFTEDCTILGIKHYVERFFDKSNRMAAEILTCIQSLEKGDNNIFNDTINHFSEIENKLADIIKTGRAELEEKKE